MQKHWPGHRETSAPARQPALLLHFALHATAGRLNTVTRCTHTLPRANFIPIFADVRHIPRLALASSRLNSGLHIYQIRRRAHGRREGWGLQRTLAQSWKPLRSERCDGGETK
jgi:hypothetical protein